MDTVALLDGTFRLGEWVVEPQFGRLTRGGTTVGLEFKVMEVLLCLARRSGTLVIRQDLIDAVWATEYVSNNTLTHAIAELRSALGDDAKNPSYIETIHRRGYRLLADVADQEDTDPDDSPETSCYYVLTGDRRVPLRDGENLIGRVPWATITVDEPQVSRRHARILVDGSTAVLEDLGSKNGTYLNGRPAEAPTPLSDGDRIGLGSHSVFLQLTAAVTTEEGDTPTDAAFEA